MLTYHPAFDLYHCIFRLLTISAASRRETEELDRLRIWDFYFVFPDQAKQIVFLKEMSLLRGTLPKSPNPYNQVTDSQILFNRMRPYQMAAVRCLLATGFFSSEALAENKLRRTEKALPASLAQRMKEVSDAQRYILELTTSPLNELSLYGEKGLKARTRLLDYRYDLT